MDLGQIIFAIVFTLLSNVIPIVECRKPEDIRPGRHDDVDRFDEVYTIVRTTFILAIAPAVLSFLFGVLKDPDLPFILKTIWRTTKKKLLGSLSNSKSKSDKREYLHGRESNFGNVASM